MFFRKIFLKGIVSGSRNTLYPRKSPETEFKSLESRKSVFTNPLMQSHFQWILPIVFDFVVFSLLYSSLVFIIGSIY